MKRYISLLLSLTLFLTAGFGLAVQASADGDITAKAMGTYTQADTAQQIVIRIELPGVSADYCVFAIDGGIELPAGWTLKGYTTSNSAQPIVAGDYNLSNGLLTYISGDVEDTIPAASYYEAVIEVPAKVSGEFSVKFKGLAAAKNYGTELIAEVDEITVAVPIADTSGGKNPPEADHSCAVCGGCADAACGEHSEKCLLLTMKFVDVAKGKWYTEGIEYVYHHGLMLGTGEGLFQIQGSCNRAMVVTILWRMAGMPESGTANPFTDVPDGQWYTDAVVWAASNGIVEGYGNGKFGPMESITREQMAKILRGYTQFAGIDTSAGADLSGFKDAGKISSWAQRHVSWAVAEGLIQGVGEGYISPQGNALRSQVATIIMRFCESILDKS